MTIDINCHLPQTFVNEWRDVSEMHIEDFKIWFTTKSGEKITIVNASCKITENK